MTKKPKTAVAYYRISSAQRLEESQRSIEKQRQAIHELADAHNLEIVKEFIDYGPARERNIIQRIWLKRIDHQPNLRRLFKFLDKNPADYVIVHSINRISRHTLQFMKRLEQIKMRGADLMYVE